MEAMDTTALASQAMAHWARWRPQATAELKAAGTFEMWASRDAERALTEIQGLVQSGVSREQAEEMVLPEYIYLPPEIDVT